MLIKAMRIGLGNIIVFINYLTLPKPIIRSTQQQQHVDKSVSKMSIYQFYGCPFCIKTRRAIHRLNLPMAFRDASGDSNYRQELLQQGGKIQVPCLRLEQDNKITWLYESNAIIEYLQQQYNIS